MVKENTKARPVVLNGTPYNSLLHDDWNRGRFIFHTGRLNKQPLGRREPLVRADDTIQVVFEFSAVDLACGVKNDANGKASQRFFDLLQYAPIEM